MSFVFVVDQQRCPLSPIHAGRARYLLKAGYAAVLRRYPFTIILQDQVAEPQDSLPFRLKIDPGSKTTGMAVVHDQSGQVVWTAELTHRGTQVKANLDRRWAVRRSRRSRKTRYRAARYANRRRPKGWLAPSLQSRVGNILTWVERLLRWCPLQALSLELVRFDMQLMQHAEIAGIQYQQGELAGYEVRQYLLEKWRRKCAYCGASGVPLEIEHVVPKSRGGTDRVSNLTLACHTCNQAKGTMTAEEFGFPHLQTRARASFSSAAAVNTTRWALYERVKALGCSVEIGSGGLTQWNRTRRGLPKTHWLDAACVGASTPEQLDIRQIIPLVITAKGRGGRQRVNVDSSGFPRGTPKAATVVQGFRTGDVVRAVVPAGKNVGIYMGRLLVRASGSFDLTTKEGRRSSIAARYCRPLHRNDGYGYQKGEAALPPDV